MEVHAASGRPRLVVVRRDGDPSAAIAIELRGDGVELALLSTVIGARLEAAGFTGVDVTPGNRVARVRALVPQLGAQTAKQLDSAMQTPITNADLPALKRALEAFAARPVLDPALARAVRCLDRPVRSALFKPPDDPVAYAEQLRVARIHADTVVVGAVGAGTVDSFSSAWRTAPPWSGSVVSPPQPDTSPREAVTLSLAHEGGVLVVDGGPRAAVSAALPLLADPEGPLSMRLRAADDFRLRGVAGAARPEGACIVIEVEPSPAARIAGKDPERFAMRAAVALEVARQETELALESAKLADDSEAARIAIAAGGDPREAADRAAWWAWPIGQNSPLISAATLSVPAASLAKGPNIDVDAALLTLQPKFSAALSKSKLAWSKSELDLKTRVEVGQGELWIALGTPCSVAHEGTGDAGLASIAVHALAPAHPSDGVTIEPWVSTIGVGMVAHAAPRAGETAQHLAHRVGDVVGRTFLASFARSEDLVRARADALVAIGSAPPGSELIRGAVHAQMVLHPSWLDPTGTVDAVAKSSPDAVDLRLATLRSGPLRIAVLANDDEQQSDSAARAAERWLPRRPGEARACPITDAGTTPKGAIHALTVKSSTGIAMSFPVDESAREAGAELAAMLDGTSGRIATELLGLATRVEARFLRGVGRHALVIVVLAPDPNIDAVVAKLRALLEKLRGSGIEAADLARADASRAAVRAARRLEPRARVVDLFSGDLVTTPPAIDLSSLRSAAAKILDEDRMQLVVARLAKQ